MNSNLRGEKCIKEFREYDKIVEFNAWSIRNGKIAKEDAEEMARLCKKYGVFAVVLLILFFASILDGENIILV